MQKVAVIVAGGKGLRMNSEMPKQFLRLQNKPILIHTIEKFIHFDNVIIVLPKEETTVWKEICKKYKFTIPHKVTEGGATRFQSVKNGLEEVDNNSVVAIHDGVRPLVSENLINSLVKEVRQGIGVIPVIPVTDSIRKVEEDLSIYIDRSNLFKVQTPQCFLSTEIKEAYSQNYSELFTDDASVFETKGGQINTILGEEKNIKITTEEDLKIADIFTRQL